MEAFEIWIWEMIERTSCVELGTNEKMLQMMVAKIPQNNAKPTEIMFGPHRIKESNF